MKKISLYVVLFILLLTFISGACVVSYADGGVSAVASYGKPEAIDGIADKAWENAASYSADRHDSGATDISASWKSMYDESALYFLITVSDSTIGSAEQELCNFADLWTKNTVHIMLDLLSEGNNYYDSNDFYIDVNARGYYHTHYIKVDNFISYGVLLTETGYVVEAAIDIGIFPDFKTEEGTVFGLDIWACDNIVTEDGRKDFVTWTGFGDTWANPSNFGKVTLGSKNGASGEYNGLVNGQNIRSLGANLVPFTNAINKDVSIIANGEKRDAESVDTFNCSYSDDLGVVFGLDFGGEYDITEVIFWEGGHWNDGGWFGAQPVLQYFYNNEWKDANATFAPAYPGDNRDAQSWTHESYIFKMDPVTCSKIRVVGPKNSLAGHVSCSELEAYGYDHVLQKHEAKEATCSEIGWEEYETCEICGYSSYKEIPMKEHSFGEWKETKPATCNEKGTLERVCVCGQKESKESEKNPGNHAGGTEIKNAVEATTGKEGYTGDTYCKGCGVKLSDGTIIEKLPETVETGSKVTEPSPIITQAPVTEKPSVTTVSETEPSPIVTQSPVSEKAADTTAAKETSAPGTTEASGSKKKGCFSSIGSAGLVVFITSVFGVAVFKKRK